MMSRNPRVEIIFGGSVMVTSLVVILARLFGRKAVVQAHGLDLVYPNSLYQLLCVRWLKLCDRVIANSAHTASLAVQKGVGREVISVIHPGVHPERFGGSVNVETLKTELGLQDKRTILYVGRLAKRKGVKEFIERCFVKVATEVPNACFVIVGNNPSESLAHHEDVLGGIKAVISNTNLQNHIRLLGPLNDDEVVKLYQACDVVVLPALAETDDVEGFGIVLLEAAAAGKPAVATRVGGIPDAIEDGKSGILVEPAQHELMSQTIIDLLCNDTISSAIGEYAKRRVKERFCWDSIIARYEKALF